MRPAIFLTTVAALAVATGLLPVATVEAQSAASPVGSSPDVPDTRTAAAAARLVDDTDAARAALESARSAALANTSMPRGERAALLVRLGAWDDAARLLADTAASGAAASERLAAAALNARMHRYGEARSLIRAVRRAEPANRAARIADAHMHVSAWTLDSASAIADSLLREDPRDAEAAVLAGRIHLLEKRFDDALEWARMAQRWAPDHAPAYVLEADALFWKLELTAAEAPLRRAIELDPFDPDARFHYGYAIWRRVDARQLPRMAAQWNLALELDPLHYLTHWHFGNGHTHLTYADYAHPADSVVRLSLLALDSLVSRGQVSVAIERSRALQQSYPDNVLPAMFRGSAFYMSYDMERGARLDSAQAAFVEVLRRKPNYGPAHNGLAAVVKQRQFDVLAAFDSLEREIATTPTPADAAFDAVFADLAYYPGSRVRQMARQQLGPSYAYLQMIARQGKVFVIPPLHHDLAQAMKRPFFRGATTFDNRQWMDIRGVGSGAAGIEYVERGSHQERNVLNHEYVHLFHGQAFTDAESRRVRQLYYDAMAGNRTLDYYAANNESEFLAQAYEAFISPVKVHPLNHKAMNTHDDLRRKDPATYAFLDTLVRRQNAYLAGDTSVFASNWAQTYTNVADSLRRLWTSDSARGARAGDSARLLAMGRGGRGSALADSVARAHQALAARLAEAAALLDTALAWDPRYQPTMLSYAELLREQQRFDEAERWIARSRDTDSTYAPTYSAWARLIADRAEKSGGATPADFEQQAQLMERALVLETDIGVRATLSGQLQSMYLSHSRLLDAVRVADDYVRTAPTVSTYLRDRRDDVAAFAWSLRAETGYAREALEFFREIVARKPQNWGLRSRYAAAAAIAGELDEAISSLEDAQRILGAGGNLNAGLQSQLAELYLMRGDSAAAREALVPLFRNTPRPQPNDRRLVRVIARLGDTDEAERRLTTYRGMQNNPYTNADLAFTRAVIAEAKGEVSAARRLLGEALTANPYHREARVAYEALGRHAQ